MPQNESAGAPAWYVIAEKEIGFHEIGNNRGIQRFVDGSHCGQEGEPWCAIFANWALETAGFRGTRSASSQSFRHDQNFIKLGGPSLGAIAVYWRDYINSGIGHVGFYVGETEDHVLTLGGNESDAVRKQFEPKYRLYGYWWPRACPLPILGRIVVAQSGAPINGSEV